MFTRVSVKSNQAQKKTKKGVVGCCIIIIWAPALVIIICVLVGVLRQLSARAGAFSKAQRRAGVSRAIIIFVMCVRFVVIASASLQYRVRQL